MAESTCFGPLMSSSVSARVSLAVMVELECGCLPSSGLVN